MSDQPTNPLLEQIATQIVLPLVAWVEATLPGLVTALKTQSRPTWHEIESYAFRLMDDQSLNRISLATERYDVPGENVFYRTTVNIHADNNILFQPIIDSVSFLFFPSFSKDKYAVSHGRTLAREWLVARYVENSFALDCIERCLPSADLVD